mgnify:CR=1 FL=1
MALHRVLETPKDKIVFDVGHQCYTHKLLTGRRKQFDHLRQLDGISGFPNPNESVHDAFIAGHGNTALSLAIGMAWAKKIKHEPGLVVALIGDGAFTGGMVYEGMNNIGGLDNLLVILNDNKMSISKNVGALARYLTHLRTTTAYYDAKDNVRSFLDGVPLIGPPMKKSLMGAKTLVRRAMYHSTMFEDMGFEYIGPVDGHNVEELERTLRSIYQRPGPHFLHVVTKKGKGYQPAEMNPGNYHGVSAFDPDGMPDPEVAPKESFSTVFGKLLVQEGTQNPKLCAITAAMKYGTGLQFFAHRHPQRFFDVGMAEQHAVTFAAGLASQGMLPVVCIYSTFLQRSYDQIIHDVNLLKENVLFAIDRAGFVPADGETHQGIYDAAFLSQLNIPVYAPSNYEELKTEVLASDYTLQALNSESAAARKQIAVNKSQWLPKLELGYRRNTESGEPFNGVVVGFSFPLFENRNKVKIAKAQSLNVDLQRANTSVQVESELTQLYREAHTLRTSMEEYEKTFQAQQDLSLLKQALTGGQISMIEYFVEVSVVYQSKQNYLQLENQYQKAMAKIYKNKL